MQRPVTSEDLAQLRTERDEADRRYNEALTALDRALPAFGDPPARPPDFDEHQITPLNERWEILAGQGMPGRRGVRSRLAHFVWALVRPALERQQAFNSALVDHVNRNVAHQRATVEAIGATAALLRAQAAALAAFQTHLILYVQQVTAYVDTKDRLVAGHLMSVYDAAINAITDEMLKRWEALGAREARAGGRTGAVAAAHNDMRSTLATVQQATMTLKREIERMLAGAAAVAPSTAGAPAVIDTYKYVGFEDRFRGSQSDIRSRLTSYVPLFAGATDVLDVGCGRGELLELLRDAGIAARGLDLNHEMVEVCRSRGLDVAEGDLLSHLHGLPDGALGGLIAIQVVEHLDPDYLLRALDLAYDKLRPGAPIVLETINPACWFAFFSSYIRDLTHVRPVHPETLQYLLTASGFGQVRVEYRSPYPDSEKLQPLAMPPQVVSSEEAAAADLADTLNANMDKLNGLLFTHLDYAAIGARL
jgi:SAM-dependent methyltransferase